jgi:predicted peptidase
MTRVHATFLAGLLAAAAAVWPAGAAQRSPVPAGKPAPGQQQPARMEREVKLAVKANYLLYLPKDYGKDPAKKWPVILFLHGMGERGNNINLVKALGPPKIVGQRDLPFIVVSPQCPADEWWQPRTVVTVLDEVLEKHAADPDRVYLTGLSMGGFGTWDTAIEFPDRFAAIAPVCGGGNRFRTPSLKNVPTWAFHGQKDTSVPVQASIEMAGTLKHLGGDVKLTVYPELGHDCWTATYDNPELYDWFLSHKRGEKKAPANAPAGASATQ